MAAVEPKLFIFCAMGKNAGRGPRTRHGATYTDATYNDRVPSPAFCLGKSRSRFQTAFATRLSNVGAVRLTY